MSAKKLTARRLGTHPDERGTGRILAALPVVCVATEGIAAERWGKWGARGRGGEIKTWTAQ